LISEASLAVHAGVAEVIGKTVRSCVIGAVRVAAEVRVAICGVADATRNPVHEATVEIEASDC